jgi:hypothetical protein
MTLAVAQIDGDSIVIVSDTKVTYQDDATRTPTHLRERDAKDHAREPHAGGRLRWQCGRQDAHDGGLAARSVDRPNLERPACHRGGDFRGSRCRRDPIADCSGRAPRGADSAAPCMGRLRGRI